MPPCSGTTMIRLTTLFFAVALWPSIIVAQDVPSPPLHDHDAAVIQRALELSGVKLQVAEKPSYTFNGQAAQLEKLGIDRRSLKPYAVHKAGAVPAFFSLVHDDQGRVLAIAGNGPWLANAVLRELAALPELRIIAMDHNVRPELGWDHPDYNGEGFSAFADSKLAVVRIGHGFQDVGLKSLASIPSLRGLDVVHSRITEAGLVALRGNAGLTSLTISEAGRFSPQALEVFASLPNLTQMGFGEAYVTYQNGLDVLKPRSGRLERIDLRMCVITPDDVAKLEADHPAAKILMSTPEEMVKAHSWVANRILGKAGKPAGQPLAEALIAAGKLEPGFQKIWPQPAAAE